MSRFIEKILEHDPKLRQAPNPYNLKQTSEAFNRVITGREILERVTAYLITKSMHEKVEQNEYNKSTLGNVQFWFNNIRDSNKNVIKSELSFSNIVEEWSFENILISIEDAERNILIQNGVAIQSYKTIVNN